MTPQPAPVYVRCPACAVIAVCPVTFTGKGPQITVTVDTEPWRTHAEACRGLANGLPDTP